MTIIVPFRDRESHLKAFIPVLKKYIDADIVVVEQAPGKPFNRGKLLNVGVLECPDTHYVFHDVDMLPVNVDYTPTYGVTQLASSEIQKAGYLGGVTMFDSETFLSVNGYNNNFFSRAEDNEMMFQLLKHGIEWGSRIGEFTMLDHTRTGPEFIPWLWQKAQQPRKPTDGLSGCHYKVISRSVNEYTHVIVYL
ncbi:MAG: hypothetical protein H0X33_14135 [Taibaiella sp.]|nr:hypothetical protein [Taibaiella sp.]